MGSRAKGTIVGSAVAIAAVAASLVAGPVGPVLARAPHHTAIATTKTSLGRVVANAHGRAMFRFLADTHGHSACRATCRSVWPPVRSTGKPRAGARISRAHLGRTATGQVTYHGHPLYYFSGNHTPGTTAGNGLREFGARWYLVSAAGRSVKPRHHHGGGTPAPAVVSTGSVSGATVLTAANGHTLYELSSETDSPPSFTCTGACTSLWLPLLTTGAPAAGGQADPALLATVIRPDGSTQVVYDHHPLYRYVGDSAAGTANGDGLYDAPGYWYELTPAATPR